MGIELAIATIFALRPMIGALIVLAIIIVFAWTVGRIIKSRWPE